MFQFPGLHRLCVILFFFVISGCEKPVTSDDVVEIYIQKWAEFYPSRAFSEGFGAAAGKFENFSEDRVIAWVKYNHDVVRMLPPLLEGVSLGRKIDSQVLLRRVRQEIERWEQDKVLQHQPQWYAQIISQALTYLLVSEDLTEEEKFQAVLMRLEGIRSFSQLGIRTLTNASPERMAGALVTLDQVAAFFEGNLPKLMRGWVDENKYDQINKTTQNTADAVRKLAQYIRDNILPHASLPDSFGRKAYARKLKIDIDAAITPDELASLALTEIDRTRDLMVAEAQKWWQATYAEQQRPQDDRELLERALAAMEEDRVDSNQDFLNQFIDLTAKAEQFVIEHDLATVPQPTTLYIALSPDHFSGAAVGGVYQAGPFAPDSNTLFYLPSVPAGTPDAQREGFYRSFNNHFNDMIISHEMFPGHYLQSKVAVTYAAKIRSLFADGTYVEGWGSFSELIMLEAGWAEDNRLTRLAHLRKRLENATRAYVSVMVHGQGWDKERLMTFATTKGLLAPQFAINLWRRVINSPLQLPTYFIGFHGFGKLWAAEQARLGKNFSTRDFVDTVLRAGPVSLDELGLIFRQKAGAGEPAQRLSEFLESVYQRRISRHPMLAAQLGEDKDQSGWDDLSSENRDEEVRLHRRDLQTLRENFDYSTLDRETQLNYRAFEADLELRLERDRWRYHISPINQIVGLHLEIAGTLKNSHKIKELKDAKAYITRLKTVGVPIDQFIRFLKIREGKGFFLSKNVVPRLIDAAQSIIADPHEGDQKDSNVILVDFSRKLDKLDLPEPDKTRLRAEMKQALRQYFIPAYQRLIQAFEDHQKFDITDQGAWRMPDGGKFYQFLLRQYTTTDITADEVHSYGLSEVARIHGEMTKIKQEVGFKGDLQDFFRHLKTAPQFYYPNTDQGRADYLKEAQGIISAARRRVDTILTVPLAHDLVVKRMEGYREKSAPVAFYEGGSADGTVPGTINLGMYNMASVGKYDTNSLLYHEGIPGHHLQLSVMQSQKHIPDIRKYYVWWSNTAFTEGWALYGEYLAKEMGLYNDPYAEFGRLSGELWRACRLVVDSGLHAKRWTRQEAITYLNENTASSLENNARAVDRYLAVPGQATAFKIGMRKILQLREKARAQLKDKFDIREFHFIILKNGPLPLHLLEAQVDNWIKSK